MPLYEYRCEKCGEVFDAFRSVEDRKKTKCETCGENAEMQISFTASIQKPIAPYYCEGLGQVVHSRAQRKRVMKERNLEEVGNTPYWKLETEQASRARDAEQAEAAKPPPPAFIEKWKEVQARYPVSPEE